MPNLTTIPLQDSFETTLTQELGSAALTINVAGTPDFSFGGNTCYFVLSAGKSNAEVVEVESYDPSAKTLTIASGGRNVSQGASVTTTAQTHTVGTKIILSDNFKFWEDIQTAVNSKAGTDTNNTWSGTNVFTDDVSFTGATTDITMPNKTTAERTASGSNGDIVYDTDDNLFYQYKGGAWASIDTGTATPNATETIAGVSELATLAEQGAHTGVGGSGASLVLQSANTLKTPAIYTPAFLTGGTGATSVIGTWNAVTDGSVRISVDGTQRDVSGLDFNADVDMDAVAATIQAGLRALTSSTETVVWSTDKFIVSSVLATSSSAITVTSSAGVGTDISGAGGTAFMDSDTGQGTVTDAVQDQTQDESKVPVLNAAGKVEAAMTYVNSWPFGDGSDGALEVLSGTTTLDTSKEYNFTTVTVASGATLTATGGGKLTMRALGAVDISGTLDLSGSATNTVVSPTNVTSYFATGGTVAAGTPGVAGDGGAGGDGTTGTGGAGGTAASGYGGGGGGGADRRTQADGGAGGNGGFPGGTGGVGTLDTGSGTAGTAGGTSAGGGGAADSDGGGGGTGGTGGDAYGQDGSDGVVTGNNCGAAGGGGGGGLAGYNGTSLAAYFSSISGSGTITTAGVSGGAGGDGGDGKFLTSTSWSSPGGGGGGGGGFGGGAGALLIVSQSTFGGTTSVLKGTGGAGGTGGTGVAGGANGGNGVAGTDGTDGTAESITL
jgi:hypothetical protein